MRTTQSETSVMQPSTGPSMGMELEDETDIATQEILLAASNHDVIRLRDLLRNTSVNVQDPETGFTPLHAAIASCEDVVDVDRDSGLELKVPNGKNNDATSTDVSDDGTVDPATQEEEKKKAELSAAVNTVKLLFQNGAIWNDLDANNETPGCLALRLGLRELYEIIVDAGVRAELLLSRLDEYQPLGEDDDMDDEDEEETGIEIVEEATEAGSNAPQIVVEPPLSDAGDTSAPSIAQAIDAAVDDPRLATSATNDVTPEKYLHSNLTFTDDRLLDADKNGVMMSWETSIMKRSAELLAPKQGLRILNVGHGMGIIDSIFQDEHKPLAHHIIEAHPAVVARMKEQSWDKKEGVVLHEGKWQDVVPRLVEEGVLFDGIYFDTFAEEYKALREFFTEYVIGLLDPQGGEEGEGGRFGFFNGLGADRQVCYDVYSKVVEMDLFEAGFDTEWEDITIPNLNATDEWAGVRRKYWALDKYRLPTCRFIG